MTLTSKTINKTADGHCGVDAAYVLRAWADRLDGMRLGACAIGDKTVGGKQVRALAKRELLEVVEMIRNFDRKG